MANLSEDRNHTANYNQAAFCINTSLGGELHLFLVVLNICLSITAITWNALILIALRKSSVRPATKLLFRCLASTDFCVGLILQPFYLTYMMTSESLNICPLIATLIRIAGVIFCGVSLTTLTAISVERLLALLLVMRYREVVTLRRVRILVTTLWAFCGILSMLFLVSYHVAVGMVSIIMLMCLIVSVFCYTKIYIAFNRHQRKLVQNTPQRNPNKPGGELLLSTPRYKKTVSFSLLLQMALVICYFPLAIVLAVFAFAKLQSSILDFVYNIALSVVVFNSSLNPILYFWKIQEVRQAVKDTIRKLAGHLTIKG